MTEHELFETRLRTALGRYVADGPTSFDALGFARAVVTAEPRRRRVAVHWPNTMVPALAWLLVATALLLAALVGSALLIASRPTPVLSSWQRIDLPATDGWPARLNDVLATENGYLAVGESGYLLPGYVWTSDDGLTWNEVPTGSTFERAVLRAAVRTEDGYVAAGMDGSFGYIGSAGIWRSADGVAWRPAFSVGYGQYDAVIEHLASANGRLVAVGRPPINGYSGQPMVWVSDDADHWEALDDTSTGMGTIDGIVAGGPGFVAAGSTGVWTSADGDTWTRASVPAPDPTGAWRARVAVGDDGRIVVGGAGGRLYATDDGVTWTAHELSATDASGGVPGIIGLAATRWGYAAVSATPKVFDGALWATSTTLWTSLDGTSWEAHELAMIPEHKCGPVVSPGAGGAVVSCASPFVVGDTLIVWTSSEIWALPGTVSPDSIP